MGQDEKKLGVVAACLKGGVTIRELEGKYGARRSTIHRWIMEQKAGGEGLGRGMLKVPAEEEEKEKTAELKRLRKELGQERLNNRLLNAMIDVAEEQFEIPIRKKSGAVLS